MLKKLLIGIAGLVCVGALAFLSFPIFYDKSESISDSDFLGELSNDEGALEEQASLILDTIELRQGEGGFEVWRLKAAWANMIKEDDLILLEQPRLTYFMPPPDKEELYVFAEKGDVNQKEQLLRFIDNVRVWQNTNAISGSLLVYNGTDKTMTFPDGGIFTGEGMNGDAPYIRWLINQSTIEAKNGVTVVFQPSENTNNDEKVEQDIQQ